MGANIKHMNESPVGSAIAEIRRKLGLKLAGVSRYVPVSTLNAIEHGRIIPSIAMLDAVTTGLSLAVGQLDLFYLESVRDVAQRQEILQRLRHHGVPLADIQASLRRALRSPKLPNDQRSHLGYLLAENLAARGHLKRSIVILERIRTARASHARRVALLSLLGRNYLKLGRPQDALGPLLEAVRLRPIRPAWEVAMCNLGLTWWKLGHYGAAREQWSLTADRVTEPKHKAIALFGLGNVSLRLMDYRAAINAFESVLALYERIRASATVRLSVLNNLLLCHGRLGAWDRAEAVADQGRALWSDADSVVRGEFACTMAEGALTQGRVADARVLIRQTKDWLDDAPVLSWFTVRLLELAMDPEAPETLFRELDEHLGRLADAGLQTAIRLRMVELGIQWGSMEVTASLVTELRGLYPPLGNS